MSFRSRTSTPSLEELESRILYSADLAVLALDPNVSPSGNAPVLPAVTASVHQQQSTLQQRDDATQAGARKDIVFIDGALENADALADGLRASGSASRTVEVVVLDVDHSGVAQITDALRARSGLDSVHIISHGREGAIVIGDTLVDSSALFDHAADISSWGSALNRGGDLLIYGCGVAENGDGREFVDGLAQLTGADVAASTDLTGNTADGGDWVLEYRTGEMQSGVMMDPSFVQFKGVLATFMVTNTNDSGAGSLRQAITDANSAAGADTIDFSIGSGLQTITLASALPSITETVSIDGRTQGGYANAPLIELDGSGAGGSTNGLVLGAGSDGSTVRGLSINRFGGNGIYIAGSDGNTIAGNYLGTNAAGTGALANADAGIWAEGDNNVFGGASAADRNVISGNADDGLLIRGSFNTVIGNYVGLDAAGTAKLANGANGIVIDTGSDNLIGGTTAGERNVVSGNGGYGIRLNSGDNTVAGNYLGTDAAGTAAVGNSFSGVLVFGSGNRIGSAVAGGGNLTSGNWGHGIEVRGDGTLILGNTIGLNAAGTAAVGNVSFGILIHSDSTNTTVGGTAAGERNIISGNGTGILIDSDNNLVLGNYIGTNAAGTAAIGNASAGIEIYGDDNTIGGTAAGAGNVMSGNHKGAQVFGNGNVFLGNSVGTNAAGDSAVRNASSGIQLIGNDNTVGGTAAGARNLISGNDTGVEISAGSRSNDVLGNYIGTNAAGTAKIANTGPGVWAAGDNNTIGGISSAAGNVISGNGYTGIYLTGDDNVVSANLIGLNAAGDAALANAIAGVWIASGSGNVIGGATAGTRNIISGNAGDGVQIEGASNIVTGNYIGTDAAGTAAVGNGDDGIQIWSDGNTIGGTAAGAGNVVSGNADAGLIVRSNTNTIQGNLVGTNAAGTAAVANGTLGIYIDGRGNTVGGTTAGERNVVSGNADDGIELVGDSNIVLGNYIGLNAAGTAAIANAAIGVHVTGTGNTIGGTAAGSRNVISGNVLDGIQLDGAGNTVAGNYIGTDAAGTAAVANGDDGVQIWSDNNTIGGTAAGAGNVISGNADGGLIVRGDDNAIQGNLVGTNAAGDDAIGNGTLGIYIDGRDNTVGGTTAGARNVVSGNADDGIELAGDSNTVLGNYVGLNAAGDAAIANAAIGIHVIGTNNTIGGAAVGAGNVISGNAGDGVQLDGDGNTVAGNYIGTNAAGDDAIGNGDDGVHASFGTDNLIGGTTAAARNVISGNNGYGVYVGGGSRTRIAGNYIGTDAAGTAAIANALDGVHLNAGTGHIVGGTVAGAGNVISGNAAAGVSVVSSSTTVAGNIVGLNAAGTAALANGGTGIIVWSGGNTIGGTVAAARNVVAGNGGDGISLRGDGNTVQGNYIGTNGSGNVVAGLGNSGAGVQLLGAVNGNTIGGTVAGAGNVIAGNGLEGIRIVQSVALMPSGNAVLGNAIHGNGNLGIDLAVDADGDEVIDGLAGATANDAGDADTGPNALQNFPVLSAAFISGVQVRFLGSLNSRTNTSFRIEFFANASGSGYGEGQRYLGFVNVTTDGSGNASIDTTLTATVAAGEAVSATATNLTTNDTSEFALNVIAELNDAPVITSNGGGVSASVSVAENTTAVTTVVATDADTPAQTLTYAIAGGADAARFSINSSTGTLSFAAAPNFEAPTDADADNVYEVTVSVSDGNGGSDTQALSVTVTDVFGSAVVTTTSDTADGDTSSLAALAANKGADGLISLREAIIAANSTVNEPGQADRIRFDIAAALVGGAHTIAPTSALPTLTDAVVIDGSTEPDFPGTPIIELNGTGAGAGVSGLTLGSGSGGSTVRGLVINRFSDAGITIASGSDGNTIAGNYIGTNVSGLAAQGNGTGGLDIRSDNNTIGGTTAAARNVISGNQIDGIFMPSGADSNVIRGNYIGTNAAGTAAVGNGIYGVLLGSANNTIGGTATGAGNLISGNNFGILMQGATAAGNVVQGNLVGTDASGAAFIGNGTYGIYILAPNNTIGGTTAAARNVVVGSGTVGIFLDGSDATGNSVQGNYVGINAAGTATIGNYVGVVIHGGSGNTIGGTVAGAGNVISGNGVLGVSLFSDGAAMTGNLVQGNYIGTNGSGNVVAGLGNSGAGVQLLGAVNGNTIGGTVAGSGNVIAGNGLEGIRIVQFAALTPSGNAVLGNAIHGNGSLGIELAVDTDGDHVADSRTGATPNDTGDADTGPNAAQNFPVLSAAFTTGAQVRMTGSLNSSASTSFRIEFFANASGDASSYGEGQRYLGFVNVTTDGSGNATFDTILAVAVAAGEAVSATATNLTTNDTSEFTQNVTADLNDAPVITSNGGGVSASVLVAENTTAVTTVVATDADTPAQTLTYAIAGGADAARFSINSSTGALSFAAAPNFEAPTDADADNVYEVTVSVSDGSGGSDTQALSVTVTDVNDAPVIASNGGSATGSVSVAENTTAVTTVTASDADVPAQGLTYSLAGGADSARFSINFSTGTLTFASAPNFEVPADADANNFQVTFPVSGSSGGSDTQALSVTVTDANDAPIITSNGGGASTALSVAENTTASTTDTDVPTQTLTYAIADGADAARFAVNATSGFNFDPVHVTGAVISIGSLWIATRRIAILYSLLAGMPLWRGFDPLPIVVARKSGAAAENPSDDAIDDVFDNATPAREDGAEEARQ